MSSIYRYPLKPPVESSGIDSVEGPTEAIDYLVLKRSRIFYDETKAIGDVNIHHLTEAGAPRGGGKLVRRQYQDGCVYLAMPPQLSTAYQAAYSQQDIGVMGLGLAEMTSSGGDFGKLVDAIQGAAGAGLPEFAGSTATSIANSFGNMLGLAGQMDANALSQLNRGKVFNPFSEQVFKSMAFRQHQFNFKMLAKSQAEAAMIQKIIDWIKLGATPKVEAGSGDWEKDFMGTKSTSTKWTSDGKKETVSNDQKDAAAKIKTKLEDAGNVSQNQRFFQIPDHFDLRFVRVDPAKQDRWYNPTGDNAGGFDDGSGFQSMHFKIHPSFCNNVGVNYTPDGQYTSFKHIKNGNQIQVPAIQLSLQFIETRLVSQQNVQQGY